MWKSGFHPRDATIFFPQTTVRISTVIHSPLWREFCVPVFHRKKFHIPQGLCKSQELGVWS